jgi:hypothetical protein
MDYYYYYSWTKNQFIGALTKYPPTKRPRDILTQTKRPTNKPSAVIFYYCDVSTLWGFPTATLSPNIFYYYDISSPWNFTTSTFHPFNILLLRYFVSYEMSRTLRFPPVLRWSSCPCVRTSFFLPGMWHYIHFCYYAKCLHVVTYHLVTPWGVLVSLAYGGKNITSLNNQSIIWLTDFSKCTLTRKIIGFCGAWHTCSV